MTDHQTAIAADQDKPFIIRADEKGAPSFHDYICAVHDSIPDLALEGLTEGTDEGKRLFCAISHVIEGMSAFLIGTYGENAEVAAGAIGRSLPTVVASHQKWLAELAEEEDGHA
jgi:hypothetical protein